MSVNRYWLTASRAAYARRSVNVPATDDALLHAAADAAAGDMLRLEEGIHFLSTELVIDKPLWICAVSSNSILASRHPSMLRTRANVKLNELTLCRMGDADGHPNAVVVADCGTTTIERCRITCGGPASTILEALQVFGDVSPPGILPDVLPLDGTSNGAAPPVELAPPQMRQAPQSGVWVGASASVTLRYNTIACCSGPGIKIYRGRLTAEDNTIAFSRCGANVVSNSGRVRLTRNVIHGARGDGVSTWNNSHIELECNTIHSNRGTGVTINTSCGSIAIFGNSFFGNLRTAVQFQTSYVHQVAIGEGDQANDWSRNTAGGVQGLHPRWPGSENGVEHTTSGANSVLPSILPRSRSSVGEQTVRSAPASQNHRCPSDRGDGCLSGELASDDPMELDSSVASLDPIRLNSVFR